MGKLALLAKKPPVWPSFTSGIRSEAVTARVGRLLGIAFGVCFVTGIISRYQYTPWSWIDIPSAPVWGYRLTQGIHVITGIVSIPLLIVKLWSVFPKLFQWPPAKSIVQGLERLSIAVLVSSSIVEVTIGLLNILTWYPWPFSFLDVHHWLAWVVMGSLLLHISVKLPIIRRALATPLERAPTLSNLSPDDLAELDGTPGGISRRGVLIASGAGVGIVALTTAGQTFTPLNSVALLGVRDPSSGPLGVPINRTADQAGVKKLAVATNYVLHMTGPTPFQLTLAQIEAMPTVHRSFPIACVEGWSAGAHWDGVLMLDLVERMGGDANSQIVLTSLEPSGPYKRSRIFGPELHAALLATHLNGQRLTVDHGYPIRLIAPNRAGVFNTKWVSEIKVVS
jgi:hypothetical protein